MSRIELEGVNKRYGEGHVLAALDLSIPSGSIVAVLGASGSGKTTLLRLIAGFERVDSGRISIGDVAVDDGVHRVRARDRRVGYVPQEGALFPHLTVARNVGFGLARSDRASVRGLLELVGLETLARRYPHELSGGEQQRVALARALAIRPHVVLLDEPFSALDASLRTTLRRDVARILTAAGTTTILVTHDQDEALTLASQVAILDQGRILAAGDPQTLYREPPALAVATAIGEANVIDAQLQDGHAQCALGAVRVEIRPGHPASGHCRLLVRPEQFALAAVPGAGATAATVTEVDYHGHDALVRIELHGDSRQALLVRAAGDRELALGQTVYVSVAGPVQAWPAERGG